MSLEELSVEQRPSEADELWRYSRISELDVSRYTLAPDLTLAGEAPEYVSVGEHSVTTADDYFGSLNAQLASREIVVEIPKGAVITEPIVLVHDHHLAGQASFPRTVVSAGEASEACVIEVFLSDNDTDHLSVPITTVRVGNQANLRHVFVQLLGDSAWQVARASVEVGADATYSGAVAALGGYYARNESMTMLGEKGGTSRLVAAYLAGRSQLHDLYTYQGHMAPHTTSEMLFKGAVCEAGRSSYRGMVRMVHGARGAMAQQTNRTLVLSETAHADSVPELEIDENDVRCSHASAVGPIDEDQRFYLGARGVEPGVADRLIVMGFYDDVLTRFPHHPYETAVRTNIEQALTESAVDNA